jgi:MFS family permease
MAFTSMIWGTLSDRFGPLPVVLTGSVVLAASLALASQAPSLLAFQFLFGALVGAATAAIFAPMMACVTAGSIPIAVLPSRWCRPAWAWRR